MIFKIQSFAKGKVEPNWIESQKKIISFYYNSGDNFSAISETTRLINFIDDNKQKNSLNYFIYGNYYLGCQFGKLSELILENQNRSFRENLLLSYSLFKHRSRFNSAEFSNLPINNYSYKFLTLQEQNMLLNSRINLFLESGKPELAYKEVEGSKLYIKKTPGFYSEINSFRNLSIKSKTVSVLFSSLFPGAGQIYSGKYLDGFLSFVGVLATAGGSYYAYKKGYKQTSYSLGFFSALFYVGNIYGAYNSAYKNNKDEYKKYKKRVHGVVEKYDPFYGYEFDEVGLK